MDTFGRFCVAVGAILITAAVPILVLPLRFTVSGVLEYIAIVMIAIAVAAVWSIPDEDFL